MATLVVTPNPAITSSVVNVSGSGFTNQKTRLLLDGSGATSNIFRPNKSGIFNVGITVGAVAKTQTLVAQQTTGGTTWIDVARTSITVQAPTVPSPGVAILPLGAGTTAAQFASACNNLNYDVVELTASSYTLGASVYLDIDRTSRPLTVRPAAGVNPIFKGSGDSSASGGIFFGLTKPTKWITMTGLTFDQYLLAQAGIFELRQTDHITLNNMTIQNITRYALYSDKPYKTWGAYISVKNTNLSADNWTIVGANRDWSGIQIDSGVSADTIKLTNIHMSHLDYAFYENVPTTNLVLSDWTVDDCGESGTAISFHQASGTYHNINLTNSGVIAKNSSGMVQI